jgi:hypothetical protein
MAPSQPGAAVAGVQELLRQHSPGVFFQTSPDEFTQLLISPAVETVAAPNKDKATARFLRFFMRFLLIEKSRAS